MPIFFPGSGSSPPKALKSSFVLKFLDSRQVLVDHKNRTAEVPDFMGHGTHQNSRVLQQMVEAELLAIAQILGKVHDDRRQSRARDCAVSGKPNSGQEYFSVTPLSRALQGGPKGARRLSLQHGLQCR